MISWLYLAIIGHLSNAVAFIVDKSLLGSSFKRSATYAALIGSLSFLMLFATPWVKQWPSPHLYPFIIAFGGLYVLALWAFFEGLKRAEASRVVPIVGSTIPLFTLLGTMSFFGERLNLTEYVGFALLLTATWLLTREFGRPVNVRTNALDGQTFLITMTAAILFAAASVFGKYSFDHGEFLSVLIGSRFVAGCVGVLIGVFDVSARKEIAVMFRPGKKGGVPRSLQMWAAGGQLMGAFGFILVHLSIAKGSASLVNALQAVQYAAIVLVAWFGGKKIRKLLKEERSPKIIFAKSLAILLVAVGLFLIARVSP